MPFKLPERRPRSAPRPEDRFDFLAIVKGLGIALVGLFVLNLAFSAIFNSLLPDSARAAIDRRNTTASEYNKLAEEGNQLQKDADQAEKAATPDAESKRSQAEAKKREVEEKRTRVQELDKLARDAIPSSLLVGSIGSLVALLLAGATTAGYLATRFTRGRRHTTHGPIAGMGLILVGQIVPNPLFLIAEAAGLAGSGWLGAQLWVRRHGPWDGVLPEPRPSLFARRAPRTEEPDEASEPEIVDVDLADVDLEGAEPPAPEDAEEGPRSFGPRGKKARKRRSGRPASTPEDDVE